MQSLHVSPRLEIEQDALCIRQRPHLTLSRPFLRLSEAVRQVFREVKSASGIRQPWAVAQCECLLCALSFASVFASQRAMAPPTTLRSASYRSPVGCRMHIAPNALCTCVINAHASSPTLRTYARRCLIFLITSPLHATNLRTSRPGQSCMACAVHSCAPGHSPRA